MENGRSSELIEVDRRRKNMATRMPASIID